MYTGIRHIDRCIDRYIEMDCYLTEINFNLTLFTFTDGVRNISNNLSIQTSIDLMSDGLKELAKEKGYWNGEGEFNFAKSFGTDPIGK